MPIDFDLEKIRSTYGCSTYLETGLYDPRTEVSIKRALSCKFDNVFSIEIRKDWVDIGKEIFKEEIEKGRCTLLLDDSIHLKKYVSDPAFANRTLFFLDAHVDNNIISNYKYKCPLFDEIEAIKSINRKDNIILIDDLRILKLPYPWGETGYGNINFLESIKTLLLSINENYKFTTLNGVIANDVLMAYI